MKSFILIFALLLPVSAFSQDHFELVKSQATEEYPGIPQSPVVYRVVYYLIAHEDGINVDAVSSDGFKEIVVESKIMNKGDRLALQYVNYSYIAGPPVEGNFSDDPYFVEVEEDITALVFPGYNFDQVQKTSFFPVYYVNGERFEFELPEIKEEDIERIYYP